MISDDDTDPKPGAEPGASRVPASPQAGVLGNLPRSRPAVRSPRRKDAPAAGPQASTGGNPSPEPETERESESREAGGPADLEALARGGLAVAGGAASLGLRLAGRAAAAARNAVERR